MSRCRASRPRCAPTHQQASSPSAPWAPACHPRRRRRLPPSASAARSAAQPASPGWPAREAPRCRQGAAHMRPSPRGWRHPAGSAAGSGRRQRRPPQRQPQRMHKKSTAATPPAGPSCTHSMFSQCVSHVRTAAPQSPGELAAHAHGCMLCAHQEMVQATSSVGSGRATMPDSWAAAVLFICTYE